MKRILIVGAVALAIFNSPALAQSNSPSSFADLGGRAIAGLCVLSSDQVLATSAVGRASAARLQEIIGAAQSEVDTQQRALDADIGALDASRGSLRPNQLEERQRPLIERRATLQRFAAQRSAEMESTRAFVRGRIAAEAQPVIASVYSARRCGILVERGAILGGNTESDITADVIRQLDARIQRFDFDRQAANLGGGS